jgi:hypothetical protein
MASLFERKLLATEGTEITEEPDITPLQISASFVLSVALKIAPPERLR